MIQNVWSLHDGRWVKNLLLIDTNRAFLYGDGLFETMRTFGITTLFLNEHIKRLYSGMKILNLPFIPDLKEENIASNIVGLLNRNKWFSGARVRLTVFRNSEGRYAPKDNKTSYILTGEPLVTKPLYPFTSQGRMMCIYGDYKKSYSILSSIKSLNSLPYVLAATYAQKMNCDDTFILNDLNEIIETSNSNIFLLEKGIAISPSVGQGALRGAMRTTVCNILIKEGWRLEERGVKLEELYNADEILLTNAIQGVTWVKGLGDRRYYCEKGKAISEKINSYANQLLS